jgi:hypothetical protein
MSYSIAEKYSWNDVVAFLQIKTAPPARLLADIEKS